MADKSHRRDQIYAYVFIVVLVKDFLFIIGNKNVDNNIQPFI